jgi:Ca2+-binding RTX toxin-like protein
VFGDITVKGYGSGVSFQGAQSSVEIEAGAKVMAELYGIEARGAGSSVVNQGIVSASTAVESQFSGSLENFGVLKGGSLGIFYGGDDTHVANHGSISSPFNAIVLAGANSAVANSAHATIAGGANGFGVTFEGIGGTVTNSGRIEGFIAVSVQADGTSIVNGKHGLVTGQRGISLNGDGDSVVTNAGTISGDDYAISSAGGKQTITNTGHIEGNVWLGAGDDVLDARKGTIDGTVAGGVGDDTYTVGKHHFTIIENAGEGNGDRVNSSSDFKLPDNVETLELFGRGDFDGSGNDEANTIFGNDHDNVLRGKGGDDGLVGGLGNDILIGGEGFDYFYFVDHRYGVDHIADFEDGVDRISLDGIDSQAAFDALDIHDSKASAVIELGHGDRIILDGVKADRSASLTSPKAVALFHHRTPSMFWGRRANPGHIANSHPRAG